MLRCLLPLLTLATVGFVGADVAFAQDQQNFDATWPPPTELQRGPGHYFSITKLLLIFGMLLLWVKTTDWANQQCLKFRIKYALWNPILVFPMLFCFLLMFVLPFLVGFPLLGIVYLGTILTFVVNHNKQVPDDKQALTPAHLRKVASALGSKVGLKIAAEPTPEHERGPQVKLTSTAGPDEATNQINAVRSRQSPGFLPAREVLADAIDRRSDAVMLDYTAEAVGVRFQIDGVWHEHQPRDRESGDALLAALKMIIGLNPEERVARQHGPFNAEFQGKKLECKLTSQGTETGERVLIQLREFKKQIPSLEELGMRPKMEEQVKEVLGRSNGLILISSMPAGGLSATFDSVLKTADRYMRDYVAVENANNPERDIENVTVTRFNPGNKETAATVLPEIIRKYPNVLVVRELADAATAAILNEEAAGDRQAITSIRAKECVEALLRVLMLKVPPQEFAPVINMVLSQRLVRKLCETCKEAYTPPPEVFQQLGIPPGRVEMLYREPTQPENNKVCPDCQGLNYVGRTAIFELLVVNDSVRQALLKPPKIDVLRSVARKAGMRTLQEEGILLVVKGVTSLAELSRVLKQ